MKAILFLACVACFAAPSLTTVTQAVVNPDGSAASGEADIKINGSCQSASAYVGQQTLVEKFTNGAFSVNLVSNSGGCAGTSYLVTWTLLGGQTWQETWVVPASMTPLAVDAVVTSSQSVASPLWARGTFSIALTEPLVSDSGLLQFSDQFPYTISSVSCSTDQGAVSVNLDVRTSSAPNTTGVSVLSAPLVCSSTGTNSGTIAAGAVAGGAPVALDVTAVSGTPTIVRIYVQKSVQ